MNKDFSVAMSVYKNDNSLWVKEAINSLLNQTVKPTEIVLVVDGPITIELNNLISQYELNDIFNVIRLQENQGLGNALAICMKYCKYELVARMDSDDICLPDRFEKQLRCFESDKELAIVGANISEFIGEPENIVAYRNVPSSHKEICKYIKERCPFNHMTVMFKKDAVEKAGGYLHWLYNEDYYLWIRMYLNKLKFANIPEVLVNVRVGKEMYKRRGGWKYFKSEADLQRYMLSNNVINLRIYILNMVKRIIVQLLLPNSLRAFVFKKFART